MATHAYVRYEDDKRHAIVEVANIKNFTPDDDFSSSFHMVKWTDDSGTSDFYRARILLVGDSVEDVLRKKKAGRIRVRRIIDTDGSETEDDVPMEPPKKKKKERDNLLTILSKKKKTLRAAGSVEQGDLQQQLQSASEEIEVLKKKIEAQEDELHELRRLNRRMQEVLVDRVHSTGGGATATAIQQAPQHNAAFPQQGTAAVAGPHIPALSANLHHITQSLAQAAAPSFEAYKECPVPEDSDKVDLGDGILIPVEQWNRIQSRPKDSMFVKDLLVAVWGMASLHNRSLQGKHCPRFPDRPRKVPLTPEKVAVVRECFKKRLESRGLPPSMLQPVLQQCNRYIVEKLADIEKMFKKVESN